MKLSRLTALFEQGFLSGSNFLIMICAARILPPVEWGVFSFAMATVLMIQGLQRAAVILPMVNQCATPEGLDQHQNSWQSMQLLATAISLVLLLPFALIPVLPPDQQWISRSAGMAAFLIGPIYFYEFNRRLLILRGLQRRLVGVAMVYLVVLAVGGAVLYMRRQTTVNDVLLLYFMAQSTGALLTGIMLGKPQLKMTWSREQLSENLKFAKWAFMSSIAFSGYNFAIQGILGAISGPGAVGLFNAARNFVQPVNTLIQAMDSVDKPRASKQFAQHGARGLNDAVISSLRWLLTIGLPFVALIGIFGEQLMALAYGEQYRGNGGLMMAWALAASLILIAHPVETGLLVKRLPKQLFLSRLFAATVALLLGWAIVPALGVIGAVLSLASGWGIAAVAGYVFLRK